jgi:Membrane dipeptidase (Peptidase family M19)
MYKHKVLVDISHMNQQAIDETFALIEELDTQSGRDPASYPVLATHVGMRDANSDTQAYNLDVDTARRVQARGGLIGVIMAQHQIGVTSSAAQSRELLRRHINAIAAAGERGRGAVAIGSDLDGFIKPTLTGLERAADLPTLEGWIREDFPEDADAILHGNARRVLRQVFKTRAQPSPDTPAPVGDDGFCHPGSEEELVALVKLARDEGLQLRVRGAAHSISHAVYTDPLGELPNRVSWQTPPDGRNVDVMLDRYRGWRVRDESRKLVEADAGIHLGADPSDPTGTATLETSLLWQLWKEKGWTFSNLGGITHQTVSGFIGSGSSGGSPRYSVNDNLWGFRVIDGTGAVHELTREDPDPEPFYAMAPNLGLLGVVSTITFQCEATFNIDGQEATTTVEACAVDLFGSGTEQRPSLEQFLRDTEYARLEWWPQRGAERVLVWQARRIAPEPDFRAVPYQEFAAHPDVSETFISILYAVFGNLDDLSKARPQVKRAFARVETLLELTPLLQRLGWLGKALAEFVSHGAQFGVDAALEVLKPVAHLIEREIPAIYPKLLGMFIPLDAGKKGAHKGEPQRFHDYAWHGLPMDNAADDELVPTEFTEIWLPLPRTQEAMRLLESYFSSPRDAHESYRRTGLYAWELYSAKATRFWLSPSYSTGDDEWKDGAFRIDPYWFAGNPGDPAETFYPQLWQLLRHSGIPFRLHWGKFQPAYGDGDRSWTDFFRAQYPRWDDFLRLRAARDPNNIFLTGYWRDRFGLWAEPAPSAATRVAADSATVSAEG